MDLTRYGLDKTPTLLVLQCPGATRSPEEEEGVRRRGARCLGGGGDTEISISNLTARLNFFVKSDSALEPQKSQI